jgi:hypothetical protein
MNFNIVLTKYFGLNDLLEHDEPIIVSMTPEQTTLINPKKSPAEQSVGYLH